MLAGGSGEEVILPYAPARTASVRFGTFTGCRTLYAPKTMATDDVGKQPPAPDAERQRAAAEAVREAAEQARADAEARRAEAERVRLTAEQARAAAESTRVATIAEVTATADGLAAILDEMKAVEALRRARRTLKDPDDPKTH